MSKSEKKVFSSFKDAFGKKEEKQEVVYFKDGKPLDLENYTGKPKKKDSNSDGSKQES